jgi:hypothetical protein
LRIERRQRVGEYKGGYTSFEFDVSRRQKCTGRRAALRDRRPQSANVKKR